MDLRIGQHGNQSTDTPVNLHLNCWMQAGLNSVALRRLLKAVTLRGGENLSGGDWANGIPRN